MRLLLVEAARHIGLDFYLLLGVAQQNTKHAILVHCWFDTILLNGKSRIKLRSRTEPTEYLNTNALS